MWEGYEDGDHIVFHCGKMWRPEARKEGEMEEWDLVEEFKAHRLKIVDTCPGQVSRFSIIKEQR